MLAGPQSQQSSEDAALEDESRRDDDGEAATVASSPDSMNRVPQSPRDLAHDHPQPLQPASPVMTTTTTSREETPEPMDCSDNDSAVDSDESQSSQRHGSNFDISSSPEDMDDVRDDSEHAFGHVSLDDVEACRKEAEKAYRQLIRQGNRYEKAD